MAEHENKRRIEAEELLDRVLDWALANRNTKSEWVSCYTYESTNGKNRIPQVLADIKKFLGESVDHMHIVPDPER